MTFNLPADWYDAYTKNDYSALSPQEAATARDCIIRLENAGGPITSISVSTETWKGISDFQGSHNRGMVRDIRRYTFK